MTPNQALATNGSPAPCIHDVARGRAVVVCSDYVGGLEKSSGESCDCGSLGRDDGEGTHPAGSIADTLAARYVLRKVRR